MTTGYVVDASVAVKWVVDEEGSDAALELEREALSAPSLWSAECANVLWTKARRGELSRDEARERHAWLRDAPVLLVPIEELIETAFDVAFDLDVTVYDALYLALARRRSTPLVTADRSLARASAGSPSYRSLVIPLGSP